MAPVAEVLLSEQSENSPLKMRKARAPEPIREAGLSELCVDSPSWLDVGLYGAATIQAPALLSKNKSP
jgi:hypothetical protein